MKQAKTNRKYSARRDFLNVMSCGLGAVLIGIDCLPARMNNVLVKGILNETARIGCLKQPGTIGFILGEKEGR